MVDEVKNTVEETNEEIIEEVKESKCKKFFVKTCKQIKEHPVKTALYVAAAVGVTMIGVEVVKNFKSTPDVPELANDLVEDVLDNVDEVKVTEI